MDRGGKARGWVSLRLDSLMDRSLELVDRARSEAIDPTVVGCETNTG